MIDMRSLAIDHLGERPTLHEVPEPVPGPGEVLVKVHAAGVNPYDVSVAAGRAGDIPGDAFPFVLGTDVAGTVAKLGDGVDAFDIGDDVYGTAVREHGTFADFAVARADNLAPMPRSLDYAHAAAVPIAAATALTAIDELAVGPGTTLLVVGATGGVGLFAIQIARMRDAHVIATARRETFDQVFDMGADEWLDHTRDDPVTALASVHPNGVDAILDMVSDRDQLAGYARHVRAGGRVASTIGSADGELLGGRGVVATNIRGSLERATLERLTYLIDANDIFVPIERIVPLEDGLEAFEGVASGHAHGKYVLAVA